MEHGRTASMSSLGASSSCIFSNDIAVTAGSPINSPSPTVSPYVSPCDSPRDTASLQKMSLEPPQLSKSSNNNNTFVHKLFNMVIDSQYQHLIAWNYTGASFIVCNIVEFSRDVLPKHFKHNNFSSFVRQLNMYGFHKVNKSPRGHRTLAENQIWEFSHSKFMRDRHDLLDEIKRKAMETDHLRRDNNEVGSHISMMQMAQSDIMQQLGRLQENFDQVMRELAETRQRQTVQQEMMKTMMNFLSQRQGVQFQIPPDFDMVKGATEQPPSILITSPDVGDSTAVDNFYMTLQDQQSSLSSSPSSSSSSSSLSFMQAPTLSSQDNHRYEHYHQQEPPQEEDELQYHHPHHPHSHPHHGAKQPMRRTTPLTVQTQNLSTPAMLDMTFLNDGRSPVSPSYSAYYTPLSSTPVSPNAFLSDDDAHSLYSPHTPSTPNTNITSTHSSNTSSDAMINHISTLQQQQQQQLQNGQISPNDGFTF